MSKLLERLSAPFPPATVSWRIGATNPDKSKGLALAYIDARDVQDRLDDVCGHEWQAKHHYCGGQMLACEIGIKIDGEWLWRGDGAGQSDVEAEKGAFSDSFKRAAVRWGIGRYLYDIDSPWVDIEKKGNSYVIPDRAKDRLCSMLMKGWGQNVEAPTRPAEAKPGRGANHEEPRLSETRDAIWRAIEIADSSSRVSGILRVHAEQLKVIRAASKPTFDRTILLAMRRAIELAEYPSDLDDILRAHEKELTLVGRATFDEIMRLAGERRGQLIETPRVDAGSAPMLMGEP